MVTSHLLNGDGTGKGVEILQQAKERHKLSGSISPTVKPVAGTYMATKRCFT